MKPSENPDLVLLSKSQARRAGDRLRHQLRKHSLAEIIADPANAEAWTIVRRFQREHVFPTSLSAQLISSVATEFSVGPVVPRIKRAERIVEKIARSSTALDRLQDIGGCRIVVPDLVTQAAFTANVLGRDFEMVDVDDYVSDPGQSPFDDNCDGPKGSGYRAIHIVHRFHERLIETQIRTEVQHQWAVAAERAEQVTGFPLKFGDAPADLLDYFRVASSIHALQEQGLSVDEDHLRQLSELRERITRYYRRNR